MMQQPYQDTGLMQIKEILSSKRSDLYKSEFSNLTSHRATNSLINKTQLSSYHDSPTNHHQTSLHDDHNTSVYLTSITVNNDIEKKGLSLPRIKALETINDQQNRSCRDSNYLYMQYNQFTPNRLKKYSSINQQEDPLNSSSRNQVLVKKTFSFYQ